MSGGLSVDFGEPWVTVLALMAEQKRLECTPKGIIERGII